MISSLPGQGQTLDGNRKRGRKVYFEILQSTSGGFWWRIRGANHEILASSEILSSKQSCWNAINVVKAGAKDAPVYDRA